MAWASGVLEIRAAHRSRYALIVSQLAVLLHSPVVSDVVDSWIESLRTGGLHLGGGQDGFVRVKTVGAAKRNLVLRTRQAGSPEVGGRRGGLLQARGPHPHRPNGNTTPWCRRKPASFLRKTRLSCARKVELLASVDHDEGSDFTDDACRDAVGYRIFQVHFSPCDRGPSCRVSVIWRISRRQKPATMTRLPARPRKNGIRRRGKCSLSFQKSASIEA